MTQLTPYLSFDGNCAEAMEFYKSCFGGELNIQKVGDSPMRSNDPRKDDQVMHSELKADGMHLFASDLIMGGQLDRGNGVTLTVHGGSKEETEGYFAKLSEGGTVHQPFQETFFGYYGDLKDKFGVVWGFQADKPQG